MRKTGCALLFTALCFAVSHAEPLQKGTEIGGSVGYYRYSENPQFMELEGPQAKNLYAAYQDTLNVPILGDHMVRFEGRLGNTSDKYSSSSGTSKNNQSWIGEGRALLVGDLKLGALELSPYGGYGYRVLHNDLKNTQTAFGYTRISQYHYAPVGTWATLPMGEKMKAVMQAEYAPLLQGYQYSGINGGINNTQTEGYHMRGFAGVRVGRLTVGPYAEFWRVDDSDVDCAPGFCGLEPKNFTREAGIKATYRFGGE